MQEEKRGFFEETEELVEKYVNDRLLLLKLQAAEKTANLAALLVSGVLIAMLGFFILLFVSLMLGYWFSELTGSFFYGFGLLTLLYVILFVVLISIRKKVVNSFVENTIIRIFFDNQTDENDRDTGENQGF